MNDWLWTWDGHSFGYRDGDSLFTDEGIEAGRFRDGGEVYGSDGRYLGELRGEDRLITKQSKKNKVKGAFAPKQRGSHVRGDRGARGMIGGYEDFPRPESFR